MALTEQHRNTLYQGLTQAVGDEEAVAAMLSQLPAGEDELATKSFVRTELTSQIGALERRIEERFAAQDRRMEERFAAHDRRMEERFATKHELAVLEHRLSARIVETASEVKEHVHQEMRHYVLWSYGSIFLIVTGVLAIAKFLQ